jgi:hypothetical protein
MSGYANLTAWVPAKRLGQHELYAEREIADGENDIRLSL